MMNMMWIGLGGAVGSIARYQVSHWLNRPGWAMPWGTVAVNLLGSFLLSFFLQIALRNPAITPAVRLALATGVLGGFTTYSTFNEQTLELAHSGRWGTAAGFVLVTVIGGLAAGLGGWAIGRWL